MKKSDLRREWRQNHRVAPRREIGRRPTWVYQRVRDSLTTVNESLEQLINEE